MNILRGLVIGIVSSLLCACSHHDEVDTSEYFSDSEWRSSMQHDPSLLSRKPSEKPYKMFRRNFLNAQLAKALFARNAPPTTANDLPNAEQKAVRELIELDRALADVPDTSEIDLSLIQVAIEKRNDGHINLVFTKSGSKHVRSTTATWATTSE